MIKFFKKIRQGFLSEGKTGSYFKYALGEILLVVIGIVIALQMQNCNEENKRDEMTKLTIERIQKEILKNQTQIDSVYDYHLMIKDTIGKIKVPKSEEEASQAFNFWRGLRVFRLQDAAFQTATQTGISSNIDFDLLESLNTLYTLQESYNEMGRTAVQGLYDKDFSELSGFKKIAIFINMTMVDLYYSENELKDNFDKCLKKIDLIYTD